MKLETGNLKSKNGVSPGFLPVSSLLVGFLKELDKRCRQTPFQFRVSISIVLLLAAVFRFLWLDHKPAHFDEGINGWFVDQMTKDGFYKYDPTNYHGPLHFYVEFVSLTLFGRNLWALRLPVVLVGLGTVWLAWSFRRHIGDRAALIAAAGLAISPGFVFYERYAIHETWLVLFLMMLVWGILEMVHAGTKKGLLAVIIGAAGCILTKETYLIHFIAAGLAWLAYGLWQFIRPVQPGWKMASQNWRHGDLAKALALALFAILFFYSGNFFHWEGVKGLFTTFSAWAHTGSDSAGHAKKAQQIGLLNYYWLYLAAIYEPLMLVGVFASFWALWKATWQVRWISFYALACLCAYSIIAYKTPWCIISIAWPFYLLGGIFLDRIAQGGVPGGTSAAALGVLIFGYSTARSVDLNYRRYDDDRQEYVYVQTYREVERVLAPIQALLRREPSRINLRGRMHLASYYPLPWYFGDLEHVYCPKPGFYGEDEDAEFILCDADRLEEMSSHLKEAYYVVHFRLRSGQEPCAGLFKADVFGPEFENRPPDLAAKDAP